MKRGRETRPDKIPVNFWKNEGEAGMKWLTMLSSVKFRTAKMPVEWR